ncbi:WSC domain-containing protein [Mycena amicta]|nr:WSC domain-containing protein [Mycena amicta]
MLHVRVHLSSSQIAIDAVLSSDSGGSRTLAAASLVDRNAMNLETCFAFCDQGGFNFAGVEFGSECYCDYAVQFPGTLSDVENCNMPCVGNSSQTCGAGDFLDVYWNGHPLPVIPTDLHGSSFLPWKYQGCFADNITDRVFPYQEIDTLPWNPGFCVVACETRGFTFAGLEFGNQCWCGHSLPVSPLLSDIECQMACAGNTSQICGGPERLTVYMAVDGLLCLAETQTPGFNLVAVYVDDTSTSRTLAGASFSDASMTVESCLAFCSNGGFNLAGVEYGSECYTGAIASDASCNMPCSGDVTERCGAGNFLDLYWNGEPLPVAPATVGTWQYQGCFADNVNSRALPHRQTISGVTIETCTAACKASGYSVAGLEFGQECWCNFQLPTTSLLGNSDCQTACLANTEEFCGGSSKLTVYADTSLTQTCLSSTRATPFNLQAVFTSPPTTGPASLPLHILIVTTVPMTSWDVLTVRANPPSV